MNGLRATLVGSALALTVACDGDSQGKIDALSKENAGLRRELNTAKQELDDLKFGASRLLSQIEVETKNGAWQKVKPLAGELLQRHPSSPEASQAKAALVKAEAALQKAEREAKLAEATRQEESRKRKLAEERRLAAALSKMYKNVDKVEGITWYRDQSSPRFTNLNGFFLYIGHKPSQHPWLRFRVSYNADEWLFIRSFLIVADGQRYEFDAIRFERDNGGGEIWEWYDANASHTELQMLQAVIKSKNAVIRLNGQQYRKDRTITATEKTALQNVLDAYKVLGGT